MPWYQCLIRGENFPGELIGESRSVGFYVNRFVEASNPRQAEQVALAALRGEKKLVLSACDKDKMASTSYFEKVVEVPFTKVSPKPQGFVWFIEGDESETDDGGAINLGPSE